MEKATKPWKAHTQSRQRGEQTTSRSSALVRDWSTQFIANPRCWPQRPCPRWGYISAIFPPFSHCVLTRHGGKKIDHRNLCVISGIWIPNTLDQDSRICRLSYSNRSTQWVVPYPRVNADYLKLQITTFCWGPKNSVNAENNESFIYILFKLYMQV